MCIRDSFRAATDGAEAPVRLQLLLGWSQLAQQRETEALEHLEAAWANAVKGGSSAGGFERWVARNAAELLEAAGRVELAATWSERGAPPR